MKVVVTDWDLGEREAVLGILEPAGMSVEFKHCVTADEVIAAGEGATALMVCSAPVPDVAFAELAELRFIQRMGIGGWEVDLTAAEAHKVAVAHCPKYCTDEAVAHTLALVLSLNRRLREAQAALAAGLWRSYGEVGPVRALSEVTIGLIGLGRMGERVAMLSHALGMAVIGYDPDVLSAPDECEMVDLETLLTDSDFVCLLCPATSETHHLIDADALAKMKPTAYLVNTARGALIDEAALVGALDAGALAGAALDVFEDEPPAPDHPLLGRPNVLVTPHVGYYSESSQHELKIHASRSVVHYFTGERVSGLLTPDFRRV